MPQTARRPSAAEEDVGDGEAPLLATGWSRSASTSLPARRRLQVGRDSSAISSVSARGSSWLQDRQLCSRA